MFASDLTRSHYAALLTQAPPPFSLGGEAYVSGFLQSVPDPTPFKVALYGQSWTHGLWMRESGFVLSGKVGEPPSCPFHPQCTVEFVKPRSRKPVDCRAAAAHVSVASSTHTIH